MAIVLGLDASWGGLGWTLGDASRPLKVGHAKLGARRWRMADLRDLLHDLEREIAELQAYSLPSDPPPLVVIERAPKVYSQRGNQAVVGFGLGEMAGAIELWACRPTWAYPWLVDVDVWRRWWNIRGRGRVAKKLAAIHLAQRLPNASTLLAPFDPGAVTNEQKAESALGDVAESMLLQVGAARQTVARYGGDKPPAGPRAWAKARADGSAYLIAPRQPELSGALDPRRPR